MIGGCQIKRSPQAVGEVGQIAEFIEAAFCHREIGLVHPIAVPVVVLDQFFKCRNAFL